MFLFMLYSMSVRHSVQQMFYHFCSSTVNAQSLNVNVNTIPVSFCTKVSIAAVKFILYFTGSSEKL